MAATEFRAIPVGQEEFISPEVAMQQTQMELAGAKLWAPEGRQGQYRAIAAL